MERTADRRSTALIAIMALVLMMAAMMGARPSAAAGNGDLVLEKEQCPAGWDPLTDPKTDCQGLIEPVTADTDVHYLIAASNDGGAPINNLQVFDQIPVHTTFVSAEVLPGSPPGWDCFFDAPNNQVVCQRLVGFENKLNPAETVFVDFVVHVDPNAPPGTSIFNTACGVYASDNNDPTPPNNCDGSQTTRVGPLVDLRITKTIAGNPAPNDKLTYTINVIAESGYNSATGVRITDTLPSGVTVDNANVVSPTGFTLVSTAGGVVIFEATGPVASGYSGSGSIAVTVNSNAPNCSIQNNHVEIGSNELDDDYDDNEDDESIQIQRPGQTCGPPADLRVTKTASPSVVAPGDHLTYTITVTNDGPNPAEDVVVTDNLPSQVTVESITADNPPFGNSPACSVAGSTVTCNATSDMAKDQVATITIVVVVSPTAPAGTIRNDVSVSSNNVDPDPDDNTDPETTPVGSGTDISVVKVGNVTTVPAGGTIQYTITVSSSGAAPTNVVLSDPVPPNTTLQSFTPPTGGGWSCNPPTVSVGPPVTCTHAAPTLPAQFLMIVTVGNTVAPGTPITNEVTVSAANAAPGTGGNDTWPFTTTVSGGGINTGGTPTTTPPQVAGKQITRLGGADRIDTANIVSRDSFPNGDAGAAVLARSDLFPDALTGTPFAVAQRAPLLLTPPSVLDPRTAAEIQRVLPRGRTVNLLGQTAALSQAVASQVAALGYTVVRHGGADRFATAVRISEALGNRPRFFVTSGLDFPDALAAGAAAANHNASILLTAGSQQNATTNAYFGRNPGRPLWSIGGPALRAYPGATQVGGIDRYGTAALVAQTFFSSPANVGAATGEKFPDSLTGGAHIGAKNGPMLLVRPNAPLPGQIEQYLSANKTAIQNIYVYGGTAAVGNDVVDAIQTATADATTQTT
jgi:uncharacterized repeat protein (TIGR01451 family)